MPNSKNITFDQLQSALTRVKNSLDKKANTSHGNHVPKTETANNARFLRNDNTWQTITPVNIGAADRSHNHTSLTGVTSLQFAAASSDSAVMKVTTDSDKTYLDFSRTSNAKEAEISEDLKSILKENFTKLYDHLFEGALIRCDFFVKDNQCYLNEINPVPGSLANYLFNDFESALIELSKALPKPSDIRANYTLLNQIQFAKGK